MPSAKPKKSWPKALLRAHGEPPETYETARRNHIEIIDATCPVVLRLQKRIKQEYTQNTEEDKQIVIYGKNGHAEVLGLVGQTEGKAIVIEKLEEAKSLDLSRSIRLYSQTTKSLDEFQPHPQHPQVCRLARPDILRQRQEELQRQDASQRMPEGEPQFAPDRQPRGNRYLPAGQSLLHRHLWSHFNSQMADGRNLDRD